MQVFLVQMAQVADGWADKWPSALAKEHLDFEGDDRHWTPKAALPIPSIRNGFAQYSRDFTEEEKEDIYRCCSGAMDAVEQKGQFARGRVDEWGQVVEILADAGTGVHQEKDLGSDV